MKRAAFIGARLQADVDRWRAYLPDLSIEYIGDPIAALYDLTRTERSVPTSRLQAALRTWQLRTRRASLGDIQQLEAAAGRVRVALEGRPHMACAEPPRRIQPLQGPVFIVGPARSGTTLLASLIAATGAVAIAPETHLLLRPWTFVPPHPRPALNYFESAWFKRLGDDSERVLADVGTGARGAQPAVIRQFARSAGTERFGEKTPQHYKQVPALLAAFPNARILWTHRDPRAVYASLKKVEWAESDPSLQMLRWLLSLRAWQAWRHDPRVMGIRYEDLVRSPHALTRSLERHLGARLTLRTDEERNAQPFVEAGYSTWASGHVAAARGPIHARSLWRWRQELSDDEIRLIESLTAQGMQELGYLRHFELLEPERHLRTVAAAVTALAGRTRRWRRRLRRLARTKR